MNRMRMFAFPAAACVLGALTGCTNLDPTKGYTHASQYRKGIKTVAVPIWRRGAGEFRRDIEIRLTNALVRRIEAETPYKVVDKALSQGVISAGHVPYDTQ